MKEKVVVFQGEDKFIKPRNRSYNVDKNYSNLVGDGNPPIDTGLGREYTTQYQGGGGGGVGSGQSTLQPDYQLPTTTIQPAPTTIQPAPTTIVPFVPLPFITPTGFGVAPMGGSGGGGGGEDDKAKDKKNYWWILVLVALGVGAYVYNKKKK